MIDLKVGMKIYDNAWFLRYGLEPEQAADVLAEMGVTFVISQSRHVPMQDSAVESAVRADDAERYARLDDGAFRRALGDRGIGYFACLNIGFDRKLSDAHPELLPIDQWGRRAERQDWYVGLPPDRTANISHKIGLLEGAVRALSPDGVHLGFIRWPGFWEIWLPGTDRAAMPDYCYGPETLRRFLEETGADLPVGDPVAAARRIADLYKPQWRDWKCAATARAIGDIRSALTAIKPDIRIAINTLPFFRSDFDDAVTEVFGQDPERIRAVADIFEVMAYHQILGREEAWPGAIATDVKRRTGSPTVCTLQAQAMYLEGMHAGRGRAERLDAGAFSRMVDDIERSPADGVSVFTFTDFLAMRGSDEGDRKTDRLRRFRR